MTILLKIVLWICVIALAHTYLFYPLLVKLLSNGKKVNSIVFDKNSPDLPYISVIMSLYNEEKVIFEKLQSLTKLDYPTEKIRFYVGSDGSDDETNAIAESFEGKLHHYDFHAFKQRRGKPPVVNDLAKMALLAQPAANNHVFLMTDASVMLEPQALYCLARHFKNPNIGVVDAHIRATGMREEGISKSENQYLSGETMLKHHESIAWGKMIGPFGGCYALRSDFFTEVPQNFLVDDFYITFRALEKGIWAINDLEAVCYESATHQVQDEYKRKKRIAAGSFQNLNVFRKWVLPPVTVLGFAFFSHKVLRWLGGFLIAAAYLSCGMLAFDNHFYKYLFVLLNLLVVCIPLLNWVLNLLKINIPPIKNIAYFLAMNVALIAGFFKYWNGIRENTWQRTKRY